MVGDRQDKRSLRFCLGHGGLPLLRLVWGERTQDTILIKLGQDVLSIVIDGEVRELAHVDQAR